MTKPSKIRSNEWKQSKVGLNVCFVFRDKKLTALASGFVKRNTTVFVVSRT